MNLSGAWRGIRHRLERSLDAPFYVTLTEDETGRITGLMEEADVDGLTGGGTLYATIEGHRREDMVVFVASAENAREPQRPVQFVGATSLGGAVVNGAWVLATASPSNRAGTFRMERVADGVGEETAARFEHA